MAITEDNDWALILGGSSGLGRATAQKLARHGFNLIIVHRDRKSDMERIETHFQEITSSGVRLRSFNIDAAHPGKRADAIRQIGSFLGGRGTIKVLVHSIAKGNLKPMYVKDNQNALLTEGSSITSQAEGNHELEPSKRNLKDAREETTLSQKRGNGRAVLNNQDFQLTLNAMALSLYDWTKELVEAHLFNDDARIVSFTSEGSTKAWPGYAAVSAAKATLEALTRNIALEFAPLGIKANCIQAGATETRAFRMIPGHEKIKDDSLKRNPNDRLTAPDDVANVVYLLTTDEARWITGTVIKVDGGESLR